MKDDTAGSESGLTLVRIEKRWSVGGNRVSV